MKNVCLAGTLVKETLHAKCRSTTLAQKHRLWCAFMWNVRKQGSPSACAVFMYIHTGTCLQCTHVYCIYLHTYPHVYADTYPLRRRILLTTKPPATKRAKPHVRTRPHSRWQHRTLKGLRSGDIGMLRHGLGVRGLRIRE